MKLVEEKVFNLLRKTERDTPRLASRADFITPKYSFADGMNIPVSFN